MYSDLRYAVRMLFKNPGFAAVAVLTLALGIGANTAIFSVVNAVLLRPLPFKEPERLVTVWERNLKVGYEQNTVAPATFHDWKTQNQVFEQMAAIGWVKRMNLAGEGVPVRVTAVTTSANLFPMMGVTPLLGREFATEEETPGRDRMVILSHGLWTQRYGSDPAIAGKTILLDEVPHTIIGVMPPRFVYPGGTGMLLGFMANPPADLWLPLALSSEALTRDRDSHDLQVLAKLKTGVTLEQARSPMDDLMRRIERANPGDLGTDCTLVPLQEQSVGGLRPALIVLWGAVGFVLLIACANVANLLLARAAGRQREIAIRVALGAGRRQIVRQLLSESVLLAVLSALLGILLALWMVSVLTATVGENVAKTTPGWTSIGIDWEVLTFTITLAVMTGVLFGLAPAWRAGRTDVNVCLKEGGRGSTEGVGHRCVGSALVIAEMAMAMILLVGAGLMVRSLIRLQRVDPGLNPAHLLTFELCIPDSKFSDGYQRWLFLERLIDRLKRLPGIAFAGATTGLPLEFVGGNSSFEIVGRPNGPGQFESADNWAITPDYLLAMQIPLITGRPFDSRDNKDAPLVCLIDQTIARRHFENESPLGKRIRLGLGSSPREIVGVVHAVKNRALDSSLLPTPLRALFESGIYVPYAQVYGRDTLSVAVRTLGEPLGVAGAVRAAVQDLDPKLPVAKLRPMEVVVSNSIAQPRFRTFLLTLFGALAVVLAAIGLYGVLAYTVAQRREEIGIRMALGAQMRDVAALVLRRGMALALMGVVIGLAGSLALTWIVSGLLFEVKATDPLTFAVVPLFLTAVAFFACLFPARRAAKIDPMVALRYE